MSYVIRKINKTIMRYFIEIKSIVFATWDKLLNKKGKYEKEKVTLNIIFHCVIYLREVFVWQKFLSLTDVVIYENCSLKNIFIPYLYK